MLKRLSLLLLILFLWPKADAHVFGVDHRIQPQKPIMPYKVIGRIDALSSKKYDEICTGTLVGPDLVLTNLHCLSKFIANEKKDSKDLRFAPFYKNGRADVASPYDRIIAKYTETPKGIVFKEFTEDWAIIVLKQPLGLTLGWLNVAPQTVKVSVGYAGYSDDIGNNEVMSADPKCSIREIAPEAVVKHDCAQSEGSSGGPIISKLSNGEFVINALNKGEVQNEKHTSLHFPQYDPFHPNIAVNTNVFYDTWKGQLALSLKRYPRQLSSKSTLSPIAATWHNEDYEHPNFK